MLVYHVPKMLSDSNLKIFTGKDVEKTNDVVCAIYHRKCNKHDANKDSLLALKWLDVLQENMKRSQISIQNVIMNIGQKEFTNTGESVHV